MQTPHIICIFRCWLVFNCFYLIFIYTYSICTYNENKEYIGLHVKCTLLEVSIKLILPQSGNGFSRIEYIDTSIDFVMVSLDLKVVKTTYLLLLIGLVKWLISLHIQKPMLQHTYCLFV